MTDATPCCPACEAGDHEHAELCEADYQCECACHGKKVA